MPLNVNIRRRLLALALMLVLGFSLVIPAYAADAHTYYIQTAVDTSNWIFVGLWSMTKMRCSAIIQKPNGLAQTH